MTLTRAVDTNIPRVSPVRTATGIQEDRTIARYLVDKQFLSSGSRILFNIQKERVNPKRNGFTLFFVARD